jgi:ABC-type Co2+ transport system permease subunit
MLPIVLLALPLAIALHSVLRRLGTAADVPFARRIPMMLGLAGGLLGGLEAVLTVVSFSG